MLFLIAYFLVLVIVAVIYYRKRWYHMDHRSLSAQPLFWMGIAVPVASFLFFGYFSWRGHPIDMSGEGFANFVKISQVPLALLSLSIPFSAIVTNAHRATQTASQIELVMQKNAIDRFYAHEKNFIEKIKSLDFGETDIFNGEKLAEGIIITSPHILYRKIYMNASAHLDSDYSPNVHFESFIRIKLKAINDGIWAYVDNMEKTRKGPSISDDIDQVFVILLMTYEIFDHIGVGNISNNYFYAKGIDQGIQVNIGSEIAFKQLLRTLLEIATSVIDIVSLKPLEDIAGIRRYAFSPHPYFLTFNEVMRIQDIYAASWRETINMFKHPKETSLTKQPL